MGKCFKGMDLPQDAAPEAVDHEDGEQAGDPNNENVKEQDRFLPIANIARVMKRPLPNNAKIAKDAKEIVQEVLSEFISFITSEASDRCIAEKRKTISGEDLVHSLDVVGFESYTASLSTYLRNFRDGQRHQNEAKLAQMAQQPSVEGAAGVAAEEEQNGAEQLPFYQAANEQLDNAPDPKRPRLEPGDEEIANL